MERKDVKTDSEIDAEVKRAIAGVEQVMDERICKEILEDIRTCVQVLEEEGLDESFAGYKIMLDPVAIMAMAVEVRTRRDDSRYATLRKNALRALDSDCRSALKFEGHTKETNSYVLWKEKYDR